MVPLLKVTSHSKIKWNCYYQRNWNFDGTFLHLVNRAHVPARGISPLEKKKKTDISEVDTEIDEDSDVDEPEIDDNSIVPLTENADLRIPKTIGYIQVKIINLRSI